MDTHSKSVLEELTQSEIFQKVGDICAAVNSVVNEKELLEISLKKTMTLFHASRGSIFILKDNGKDLVLKIAQGIHSEEEKVLVKQMGEGVVGRVAELKQPIFVDDISKDDRFQNFKARGKYRTPSFICAPLIIKDQLIGVINITDKESGTRFNKTELQLLDFITSQIALNYRRIQLYRKFRDIVKEKQSLEDRLGESDKETHHLKKQVHLHEKLATIGKLAGGIAHEFNNPLDGVMRYTNLCLEQAGHDDVLRGYLLEVKHGLDRMANIVRNLLACSRNDIISDRKSTFNQALTQALASVNAEINAKNIACRTDIQADIPAFPDFGMERILTNLIRNAVDAMSDGGELSVQARCENDVLAFSVSDTGSGISDDLLSKIFDPFFTTKDIDKGCGLGLTIVGEVVKNYDGKIDVESAAGKGTTFTIRIPLEESVA